MGGQLATKYAQKFTHVARKATIPVQNGANLKVDFFESLNYPRYHIG